MLSSSEEVPGSIKSGTSLSSSLLLRSSSSLIETCHPLRLVVGGSCSMGELAITDNKWLRPGLGWNMISTTGRNDEFLAVDNVWSTSKKEAKLILHAAGGR